MSETTKWVVGMAVFAVLALLGFVYLDQKAAGFAIPALLIIISLGVFVLLMIYATTSLSSNGLADASQPFGLPSGTVRAILTLAFVVLVGVFGSYILAKSNDRRALTPVEGLTAKVLPKADADAIATRLGDDFIVVREANGDNVTMTVFSRPDYAAADDVAKQIVTILATLLSAMIGFYFGARSEGGENRADPATETARARLAEAIKAQDEKPDSASGIIKTARSKLDASPPDATKQKDFENLAASLTKSAEDLKAAIREARNLASDSKASRKALEEAASKMASLGDALDKASTAVENFGS